MVSLLSAKALVAFLTASSLGDKDRFLFEEEVGLGESEAWALSVGGSRWGEFNFRLFSSVFFGELDRLRFSSLLLGDIERFLWLDLGGDGDRLLRVRLEGDFEPSSFLSFTLKALSSSCPT